MKQKFGRMLALALALIMLCGVLVPAYAAAVGEGEKPASAPVSGTPQPEQTPQPESEEAPEPKQEGTPGEPKEETTETPDEPKEETSETPEAPKEETSETPEAPKEETTETPEAPKEETTETPEAPKDDNTIIVPPVDGETEQPEETTEQPETTETDPQEEEYLLKIHEVLESEDPEFIAYWAKQLMEQEAFVNFLYLQSTDVRDAFLAKIAPYYTEQPTQDETADQPELLAAPPWQPSGQEYTFTFNLDGVELAYFYYNKTENAVQESPTDVLTGKNRSLTKNTKDLDGNALLLCFVKPSANHLLTSWSDSTGKKFDFYSTGVDAASSQIAKFTNLSSYIEKMKKDGYLAYFGFTMSAVYANFTCTIAAEEPTMEVTATTGLNDVEIGDKVTFTVKIKPDKTDANYDVDKVEVTNLKIGETEFSCKGLELVKNGDFYETKVEYTVTEADYAKRTVNLYVEAEITYSKALGLKDSEGVASTVETTSKVTQTANKEIAIVSNPNYVVSYDPELVLSEEVEKATKAPVCDEYLQAGEPHTVLGYKKGETVEDEDNGGTWTFSGWYLKENPSEEDQLYEKDSTYWMSTGEDGKAVNVTFYGKWTFVPNAIDFVLTKKIDGNMIDKSRKFDFEWSWTKGEESGSGTTSGSGKTEEPIGDGGKVEIKGVPIGAELTIKEVGAETNEYTVTWKYDAPNEEGTTETVTVLGSEVTVNVVQGMGDPKNPVQITCTNFRDITPDTGISMDSLPYILMLTAAGAAGILLALRRRHTYDI